MSDLIKKLSKVGDDAEYEAYYNRVLSNLRAAKLPHPEESAKDITDVIFGRVQTYSLEDLE